MIIDTRIIDNFLSDDEINIIDSYITDHAQHDVFPDSVYSAFDFYSSQNQQIIDILAPKFAHEFGPILHIQQIHRLESNIPYGIHTDVDSGWEPLPASAATPAWTFIIPLATYNSHTIVFDQQSDIKNVGTYVDNNPPLPTPTIDDATYQRYFTHEKRHILNWFSIEQLFPWTKGSLFAANRRKFHSSDNYKSNGLENKRAIVAWTSVP
jgi:hypothetical protein